MVERNNVVSIKSFPFNIQYYWGNGNGCILKRLNNS